MTDKERMLGEEALAIATESGNNFHCKVINYFREKKWEVLISPFYVDPITDKPRETDIIAEKVFASGYYSAPAVRVRLFIECKYVRDDSMTVFWFDDRDMQSMERWVRRHTPFREGDLLVKRHHYYLDSSVAKLFQTRKAKQKIDDNQDSDPISRAINQCLHGYASNAKAPMLIRNSEGANLSDVSYPVIVFSDFKSFYRTDVSEAAAPVGLSERFQMEVNYALPGSSGVHQYFLIDMLQYGTGLNAFVKSLENEADAINMSVARSSAPEFR